MAKASIWWGEFKMIRNDEDGFCMVLNIRWWAKPYFWLLILYYYIQTLRMQGRRREDDT